MLYSGPEAPPQHRMMRLVWVAATFCILGWLAAYANAGTPSARRSARARHSRESRAPPQPRQTGSAARVRPRRARQAAGVGDEMGGHGELRRL